MQLKCNVVLHLGVNRQTWNLKAKLGAVKYDFWRLQIEGERSNQHMIFYGDNICSLCGIIIVLDLSDSNIKLSIVPNALSNLS